MCNKKCNCLDCEMLLKDEAILFVDDLNPFSQRQAQYPAFKCMQTGKYDIDTPSLKRGGFNDDVIYASEHKIAIDYINRLYKLL